MSVLTYSCSRLPSYAETDRDVSCEGRHPSPAAHICSRSKVSQLRSHISERVTYDSREDSRAWRRPKRRSELPLSVDSDGLSSYAEPQHGDSRRRRRQHARRARNTDMGRRQRLRSPVSGRCGRQMSSAAPPSGSMLTSGSRHQREADRAPVTAASDSGPLVLPLSGAASGPELAAGDAQRQDGRRTRHTDMGRQRRRCARVRGMRTTREEQCGTAERRRADICVPTPTRGPPGTFDGGERQLPSEQRRQRERDNVASGRGCTMRSGRDTRA